jgi:hypothetical protein
LAALPACKGVWLVRQFPKLRPVDLDEEFDAAGAEAAHLATIEFGDEHADGGVQLCQVKEALIAQTRQDPALGNLHGDFDFGLSAGSSRRLCKHLTLIGYPASPARDNRQQKRVQTQCYLIGVRVLSLAGIRCAGRFGERNTVTESPC